MVLPNQLTVLRIILSPVFLLFILSNEELLKQIALGIYLIAALTDWYDGWLARKFNYITAWGKFWDPLADKILTSAAFIGFVILDILNIWMVLIILARDFIVTALRAYADYKGKTFPTSFYAKLKTFVQMIFLYYLLLVYVLSKSHSVYSGNEDIFAILLNSYLIFYAMLLITVITVHSGFTYIYKNRFLIKRLFSNES